VEQVIELRKSPGLPDFSMIALREKYSVRMGHGGRFSQKQCEQRGLSLIRVFLPKFLLWRLKFGWLAASLRLNRRGSTFYSLSGRTKNVQEQSYRKNPQLAG
jgi:hypothetical protein